MRRAAVFGGTAEGRRLGLLLTERGVEVGMFVATDYGRHLLPRREGLAVFSGRLDRDEMARRLSRSPWDVVVDATHPYAAAVTANLREACRQTGLPYLRLTRKGTDPGSFLTADSAGEAARLLEALPGNVLLTIGSKELAAFAAVTGARERLFARVLPDPEVLAACRGLGFAGRNLIGMQGPFTRELNAATIRMLDISVLVTKDSGAAGGVPEKLAAAEETGATVLLIGRPAQEEGSSLEEILALLESRFDLPPAGEDAPLPRFPLFVELTGRPVLVVGGGGVAARRVRVLLRFGAEVTVLSPRLCPELEALAGRFHWRREEYQRLGAGWALAAAATDDRAVNRQVGEEAARAGIPVSVADRRGESTFWFPAIVEGNGLVAGMVSRDGDHRAVKEGAAKIRRIWEEQP